MKKVSPCIKQQTESNVRCPAHLYLELSSADGKLPDSWIGWSAAGNLVVYKQYGWERSVCGMAA